MAITLRTVISELSFINELANASPKDKRLSQLVQDVQTDLAIALKEINADDPLIRSTKGS